MPLKNTRIIPRDWSSHHAAPLPTSMNATCYVIDPSLLGSPSWDPVTGEIGSVDVTPALVLGSPAVPLPCRIVSRENDDDTEQAGQSSTRRRYLVQIADPNLDLPIVVERHEVVVAASLNDPSLVGQHLRVTGSALGSERFVRDIFVEDNQQPEVSG